MPCPRYTTVALTWLLALTVGLGGTGPAQADDHRTGVSPTLSARFVTFDETSRTAAAATVVIGRLPQVDPRIQLDRGRTADIAHAPTGVHDRPRAAKYPKKAYRKSYKKRHRTYAKRGYARPLTPHRHASSWHNNPRRGGTFNGH